MDSFSDKNECIVCYEPIDKTTGQASLSCGHIFHICCLVKWFSKQIDIEAESSCPTCRYKVKSCEDLPEDDSHSENCECDECMEEEEEDDEDEEYDDEEEEEEKTIPYNYSLLHLTITRNEDDSYLIEIDKKRDPHVISSKIQAIFRGYILRKKESAARIIQRAYRAKRFLH